MDGQGLRFRGSFCLSMLEARWTCQGGVLWTTPSCLQLEASATPSVQDPTELTQTTLSWLCRWKQENKIIRDESASCQKCRLSKFVLSRAPVLEACFDFTYILLSDGPIHWPRHHPHSKSWDPVLRTKRSIPSVSVRPSYMEIYQPQLQVTRICRSFDEEKCSPIRLFSNDPFWKVTTIFLFKTIYITHTLKPVVKWYKCDNLRGRRPVWTLLEAFLLPAWNVAFRRGNDVFLQYSVSTVCFQGAAEPDYTLDWWVKHLWKHWWRRWVLEGTWWKAQGDLKHIQSQSVIFIEHYCASRRQVNEVVRDLCHLVRRSPLEKWQVATFAAVGKR